MEILGGFKDVSYQGYMRNEIKNKPTDTYNFLVKQLPKCIQNKQHVTVCTRRVKSNITEKEHVNKKIQSGITSVNKSE